MCDKWESRYIALSFSKGFEWWYGSKADKSLGHTTDFQSDRPVVGLSYISWLSFKIQYLSLQNLYLLQIENYS